jgi:hypothetical protein
MALRITLGGIWRNRKNPVSPRRAFQWLLTGIQLWLFGIEVFFLLSKPDIGNTLSTIFVGALFLVSLQFDARYTEEDDE